MLPDITRPDTAGADDLVWIKPEALAALNGLTDEEAAEELTSRRKADGFTDDDGFVITSAHVRAWRVMAADEAPGYTPADK